MSFIESVATTTSMGSFQYGTQNLQFAMYILWLHFNTLNGDSYNSVMDSCYNWFYDLLA